MKLSKFRWKISIRPFLNTTSCEICPNSTPCFISRFCTIINIKMGPKKTQRSKHLHLHTLFFFRMTWFWHLIIQKYCTLHDGTLHYNMLYSTWHGMTQHDTTCHVRHRGTCCVVSCHVISCRVMSRKLHDMTSVQRRQFAINVHDMTSDLKRWLITWCDMTWQDTTLHCITFHSTTWHDMTLHYIWKKLTWHQFLNIVFLHEMHHVSRFHNAVDMYVWNCIQTNMQFFFGELVWNLPVKWKFKSKLAAMWLCDIHIWI